MSESFWMKMTDTVNRVERAMAECGILPEHLVQRGEAPLTQSHDSCLIVDQPKPTGSVTYDYPPDMLVHQQGCKAIARSSGHET